MNEKVTLGVAALLLSAGLWAQPVINASDFSPSAGESFTLYSGNYHDPGAAGNNVTWDLSALTNSGTMTNTYGAANGNYPGTNSSMTSGTTQTYYNMNDNGWYCHAINANGTIISYQDPMKMYFLPMEMNAGYTDDFDATFTSGVAFQRVGTMSGTVDGYGTLITPEGTFDNVLRVAYIQDYSDLSDFMDIDYLVTVYSWFKAGFHSELASVSTLTSSLGTNNQYGYYLETQGLGLSREELENISVFPNPAKDHVTMRISNGVFPDAVSISDINGKSLPVNSSREEQSVRISTEDLTPGMYFLKAQFPDGSVLNRKFTVE
ncbi:MAG: hypothetical protein K0R65_324 [Crocinitomicaceae bacterium]|jgi:hypothetical protein|nr:hypothetical protein [Crocinitomicaceae bacterium]